MLLFDHGQCQSTEADLNTNHKYRRVEAHCTLLQTSPQIQNGEPS